MPPSMAASGAPCNRIALTFRCTLWLLTTSTVCWLQLTCMARPRIRLSRMRAAPYGVSGDGEGLSIRARRWTSRGRTGPSRGSGNVPVRPSVIKGMKPWQSARSPRFHAAVVPWLAIGALTIAAADVVGTRVVFSYVGWNVFQDALIAAGLVILAGGVWAAAPGLVSGGVMAAWGAASGFVEHFIVDEQWHRLFVAHPALMQAVTVVRPWYVWWTPIEGVVMGAVLGLALTPLTALRWSRSHDGIARRAP